MKQWLQRNDALGGNGKRNNYWQTVELKHRLVCDAINVAMREIFVTLAYGRSQSAFSEGGLEVGSALEDLGKQSSSSFATVYGSENGPRYLNLAEGYITKLSLDKNGEVIGYEYVDTNALIHYLKNNVSKNEDALKKNLQSLTADLMKGVTFID